MLTNSNKCDIINPSIREADFLCQNAPLVCEEKATAFLIDHRTRGFLLEGKMKTKICYICKKQKSISEFYQQKIGRNKGCYYSYCKRCDRQRFNQWLRKKKSECPWYKTFLHIRHRLAYQRTYKNRKSNLTMNELKTLWFRDKAYLMKHPSIDRINNDKDYFFDNCRYLEFSENSRRAMIGGNEGSFKKGDKSCNKCRMW